MFIKKLRIGKSFSSSKRLAQILERKGCGAFGPVCDDNKWKCDDGDQAKEFLSGEEYIVLPKPEGGESRGEQCYRWLKEWVEGQGKSEIPCAFVLLDYVDTRIRDLTYPFELLPIIPKGIPIMPPLCLLIHKIKFNETNVTISLGDEIRASIKYEDFLSIMRGVNVGSSSYRTVAMRSRIEFAVHRWNYLNSRHGRMRARQGLITMTRLKTLGPNSVNSAMSMSLWK